MIQVRDMLRALRYFPEPPEGLWQQRTVNVQKTKLDPVLALVFYPGQVSRTLNYHLMGVAPCCFACEE